MGIRAQIVKKVDTAGEHNAEVIKRAQSSTVGQILQKEVATSITMNFISAGRDASGATGVWPKRKKSKFTHKLLMKHPASGLFASILPNPPPVLKGGKWIVTMSTNLKYAAIHNYGGIIPHPGTSDGFGMGILIPPHDIPMPQRQFMMMPDKEVEEAGEKADRYIFEGKR